MDGQEEFEKREMEFRQFVRRLLNAQTYDFLEVDGLYSQKTLYKTLDRFCEIIADTLNAYSCTIHLMLYNPAGMIGDGKRVKLPFDAAWETYFRAISKGWKSADASRDSKIFRAARERSAKSALVFPYWQYPKGAAILVATNQGPWASLLRRGTVDRKRFDMRVARLGSGVTSDIFQDNAAFVRDPLTIRQHRGMRKLGGVDHLVWTNKNHWDSFKGYFGAPIRLHAGGEVVGVLKVENKVYAPARENESDESSTQERWSDESLPKPIRQLLELKFTEARKGDELSTFESRVLEALRDPEIDVSNVSLFALKYLAKDLEALREVSSGLNGNWRPPATLNAWLRIPYPRSKSVNEVKMSWLKTNPSERPPIQIVAGSIRDEQSIISFVSGKKSAPPNYTALRDGYESVNELYDQIYGWSQSIKYDKVFPRRMRQRGWLTLKHAKINVPQINSLDSSGDLPHFYYKLNVNPPKKSAGTAGVDLYVFVPPSQNEIENLHKSFVNASADLERIKIAYHRVFGGAKRGGGEPRHSGDLCTFHIKGKDVEVIDLLVDRWAARIQSFNHCLPAKPFTAEDAHRLSWAALEIGSLIRREIAYRAGHAGEGIPLTANEFDRLPISDLSFVDDLNRHRDDARRVEKSILYRVQNMVTNTGFESSVSVTSRVKESRSYLERLAERHEGFVRGSIAVWLYLLALSLDGTTGDRNESSTSGDADSTDRSKEFIAFRKCLGRFRKRVVRAILSIKNSKKEPSLDFVLIGKKGSSLSDKEFGRKFRARGPRLVGDTHFVAPPFSTSGMRAKIPDLLWRVIDNLTTERLLERGASGGSPKECTINVAKSVVHTLKKTSVLSGASTISTISQKMLSDLIYRQYQPYSISSVSLFAQLLNLQFRRTDSQWVENFYAACYHLRKVLSSTRRDMEESPHLSALTEVFGSKGDKDPSKKDKAARKAVKKAPSDDEVALKDWSTLVSYIERFDTVTFCKEAEKSEEKKSDVTLTLRGIYKRIRHLNHTLQRQRAITELEHELDRFDLLGVRLDCLFKNQTFAMYEKLWNLGDPFVPPPPQPSGYHSPWLSLRTHFHKGDYNALQIAALVDPDIFDDQPESPNPYSVPAIQELFSTLARKMDPDFRARYDKFRRNRTQLGESYKNWFKTSKSIQEDRLHQPGDPSEWFGSFAAEAAIDYILELTGMYFNAREQSRSTSRAIYQHLRATWNRLGGDIARATEISKAYTTFVLKGLSDATANQDPWDAKHKEKFHVCLESIYQGLSNLIEVRQTLGGESKRNIGKWKDAVGKYVKAEEQYFLDRLKSKRLTKFSSPPLIFVSRKYEPFYSKFPIRPNDTAVRELDKNLAWLRRMQGTYLFYRGENATDSDEAPGLCLRDVHQIRHRLEHYALLYNPRWDAKKKPKQAIGRWGTSFDLFCYLRSLVPVEIQIRTELANTMAEQYHDTIYKGRPPTGTELPRDRMRRVASQLDDIDRELEIDYEDYISRRRVANKKPSADKGER